MASNFTSAKVVAGNDILIGDLNSVRLDVLQNAGDCAASTGSANAYVLAVDAQIVAYSNYQVFKFKANFANTAAATLNVNSLGAKIIKKNGNTDLDANDILNGQIVQVIYDGTNLQIVTPNLSLSLLHSQLTAGENITAGNSVAVGSGNEYTDIIQQTSQGSQTADNSANIGQTFLTPPIFQKLTKVKFKAARGGGGGSWTLTISVYATSGGIPTGSSLGSGSVTVNTDGLSEFTVTLGGGGVVLSPNTTYAVATNALTYSGPTTQYVGYQASDVYANGAMYISTDGTSTWSLYGGGGKDMYFKLSGIMTVAGSVYRTYAATSVATDLTDNYIGFAAQTISSGNPIFINVDGIDPNQSSLSLGQVYYVGNTAGAIATSAGTVSRKVGVSLSASTILIKHDNP